MIRGPFKTSERLNLSHIQSEVSNVLERLWRFGANAMPFETEYAPAVEVWEEQERYLVTVEVPGVDAATLEVAAGPSSVTISGDKRRSEPPVTETAQALFPRPIQAERRYGQFSRTIALPGAVKTDGVAAKLTDGVLTLELPKLAGPKPIEVHVEVKTPAQ
jgi:HSP20 family protein